MHQPSEYFNRYIPDLNTPEYATLRARLRGVEAAYTIDDSIAEADAGIFGETAAERSGRDPMIEHMAKMQGYNTSDPFSFAKFNPQKSFSAVDTAGLSPKEIAALEAGIKAAETAQRNFIYTEFGGNFNKLEDSFVRYKFTGRTQGFSGVQHSHHLENVIHRMGTAQSDVFISAFQIEHPTVLDGIREISRKVNTNVVINDPRTGSGLGLAAEIGYDYLNSRNGIDKLTVKSDPRNQWSHAKFFGFDIESISSRSAFIIGSTNATTGAMGRVGNAIGRNFESNFTLDYSMVKSGEVSLSTFASLMVQAKNVKEWLKSKDTFARDFGGWTKSKFIGTGTTAMEHYNALEAAGAGDVVRISNFQLGEDVASWVEAAVKRGARVEVLTGVEHSKNDTGKATTFSQDVMLKVQDNLASHYEAQGMSKGRARRRAERNMSVVRSEHFVHNKMAIYQGASESKMILGSSNMSDGMLRGFHHMGSRGNFGNDDILWTKDLDILLHSDEFNVAREAKRFDNIAYGMKLFRKNSNYAFSSVHDELSTELAIKQARDPYATVNTKQLLDTATGKAYGSRVSLGGLYSVAGMTVNMGELMNFSVVQNTKGLSGQLYIPEFGKYVGKSQGVGFDETNDLDVREYSPLETIVAGISGANRRVSEILNTFHQAYGADAVNAFAQSGYLRATLKREVKKYMREDTFANFAGYEPGEAVYDTKSAARLAFPVDAEGNLRLDQYFFNVDGERRHAKIMPQDIEFSQSTEFARMVRNRIGTNITKYKLGADPVIYRTSGLSNERTSQGPKDDGYSASRFYNLREVASSLPISAKLSPNSDDDYFFMMPLSKINQIAQRLGNIMSARSMGSDYADASLAGESLLRAEDGKALKGVRFVGYMAPGMGGDVAYFDAARLGESKFSTGYSKTVKGRQALIDPESFVLLRDHLTDLAKNPNKATHMGGGKYRISTAGLDSIGHTLNIMDILQPGTEKRIRQGLALPTSRHQGADVEFIIDLDKLSLQLSDNTYKLNVEGEVLRSLQTGDRVMTGMKAPLMIVRENSRLFTTLDRIAQQTKGTKADTYTKMGLAKANVLFGSGTIKTGDALIQTGLEVIKSGLAFDIINESNVGDLLDSKFFDLFDRFKDYVDPATKKVIDNIRASDDASYKVARAKELFQNTRKEINRRGHVTMSGRHTQHIASAFLAFGLHANNFLSNIDRTELKGLLGDDLLGIIPLSFISTMSASAVTMSSRNRVNFLNYHSGKYTDSFMDMMAMDQRVTGRVSAYSELISHGLLEGLAPTSEYVVGGLDNTPMSFYTMDMHNEFIELTALQRYIAGKSSKYDGSHMTLAEAGRKLKVVTDKINIKATSMASKGPSHNIVGSYESSMIHSFLEAEKAAGVGARTLMVPELGKLDERTGKFVFSESLGTASLREIRLMSANSLLSLGSFEDFSHEIQAKQVEIIQMLPELQELFPNGRVRAGGLTDAQREVYSHFMELVSDLEDAQKAAAATDFQKALGGQLSVGGQNMIVGMHHELPEGVMVLGTEAYKNMKDEAIAEIKQTFREKSIYFGKPGLEDMVAKDYRDRVLQLGEKLGVGRVLNGRLYGHSVANGLEARAKEYQALTDDINALELKRPDRTSRREVVHKYGKGVDDRGIALRHDIPLGKDNWRGRRVVRSRRGIVVDVIKGYDTFDIGRGRTVEVNPITGLVDKVRGRRWEWNLDSSDKAHYDSLVEEDKALFKDDVKELRQRIYNIESQIDYYVGDGAALNDDIRYELRNLEHEATKLRAEVRDMTHGRAYEFKRRTRRHEVTDPSKRRDQVRREIQALKLASLSTDEILEKIFENPESRHKLMTGMFQRAGAPMGPMGLTANKIYTIQEANDLFFKTAPMSERHFRRSVLMGAGSMMFNFGDFDGDTASVARLNRYTALQSLALIDSGLLTQEEELSLKAVNRDMRYSAQEKAIKFAYHVLGDNGLFSDDSLYDVTRKGKQLSTARARAYLHALESRDKNKPGSLTADQTIELNAFRARKDSTFRLAVASIKFSADITGISSDVSAGVRDIMSANSHMTEQDAYLEFMGKNKSKLTDSESYKLLSKELASVSGTLVDDKTQKVTYDSKGNRIVSPVALGAEGLKVTDRDLAALFSASAFAATFLIGKVYEASFTVQTHFDAKRAKAAAAVVNAMGADGTKFTNSRLAIESLRGKDLTPSVQAAVDRYDAVMEEHTKVHSIVLLAQQMARDAIKPKIDQGALSLLRSLYRNDASEVASGMEFVLGQERTQALEAFYTMVEGKDFLGLTNSHTPEQLDAINRDMARGFTSFYSDQVSELNKVGGPELVKALLKKNSAGYSIMAEEHLVGAFTDDTSPLVKELMAWEYKDPVTGLKTRPYQNIDDLRSFADDLINEKTRDDAIKRMYADKKGKALVDNLLKQHLMTQGQNMADWASYSMWDPSLAQYRQDYIAYGSALNGADSQTLFNRADGMSRKTKLQIFANMASRGKIRNADNFKDALTDILMDYNSADDIRKAASQVTDAPMFADSIQKIYDAYAKSTDVSHALQYLDNTNVTKIKDLNDKFGDMAYDDIIEKVDAEKLDKSADAEEFRKYARHKMEASWAGMLGVKPSQYAAEHKLSPNDIARQIDQGLETRGGRAFMSGFGNIFVGAALGAATMAGVMGGSTEEAFAANAAIGATMMNPTVMIKSIVNETPDKGEAAVRLGIIGGSIAAGMGGAMGGVKMTQNLFGKSLQATASKVTGAIGGGLVGLGAAFLLEAAAHATGLLKTPGPLHQMVSQLGGLTEAYQDSAFDDMDTEFGGEQEYQVIYEATGEVLAVYHRENSEDHGFEADDDTISFSSYEAASTEQEGNSVFDQPNKDA
jgi:stringent starvation protein B